MKNQLLLATLLLSLNAQAGLYTESFTVTGGTIADGNPVGTTFAGVVSDIPAGYTIGSLTVGLNLSGGYNGDLYAYLVAPDQTMVMLLNQPGTAPFYAPGSGLNVTLDASAGTGIQTAAETAGVQFTGTYSAAGNLADFNGLIANGTWTLYFADLSSGGGTSTLNSWSLGITAVPEPANVALGVFAGLFAVAGLAKIVRRRKME